LSDTEPIASLKPSRYRTGRIIVYLVLWATSLVALLYFDVSLMQWRYSVLPDGSDGLFKHLLNNCREFGQLVCNVIVLIIVIAYDRRWKSIVVAILLAQGVAAVVYNPGKMLIARYRPESAIQVFAKQDEQGVDNIATLATFTSRNTWLGWRPGNVSAKTQSFPSGHSAGAFALALLLARVYPRLAWLFWTLAVGCATSRYLDAVHWPSDCLVGATIGYLAAMFSLWLVTKSAKRQ